MTETLTADERRILEDCYRCRCSGCARRRELIAKALRIIDVHARYHEIGQPAVERRALDAWNMLSDEAREAALIDLEQSRRRVPH